jgi:hypothetical protein
MKAFKTFAVALGLAVPLALAAAPASAEDQLKLAIGQINNWENQAPTLGQDIGIFKKYGLVLENVGTRGAGETMQPIIAGSADIGTGVGVAGAMRAFEKGAPVRILAPMFTGTGDLFWYVKSDSKIQTLKDATPENTIAYSTNGSSSNNIVVAFTSELGCKAKPTATGSPAGTLTAVMSGQVDIGWAAPPFGLKEINAEVPAEGDDADRSHGRSRRRRARCGQTQIPREAIDQGTTRRVHSDSAAQEIARGIAPKKTGRCFAAARCLFPKLFPSDLRPSWPAFSSSPSSPSWPSSPSSPGRPFAR